MQICSLAPTYPPTRYSVDVGYFNGVNMRTLTCDGRKIGASTADSAEIYFRRSEKTIRNGKYLRLLIDLSDLGRYYKSVLSVIVYVLYSIA